jgi:phosphinothricin acetyltransferase
MSLGRIDLVPMSEALWDQVSRIYAAGIATGHATFETSPPTWDQFNAVRLPEPRLVARAGSDRVLGWVACSRVSQRAVYAGVVEHSLFVDPPAQRQGVGRLLLAEFVAAAEAAGMWTVQSGIFPENVSSLRLHAQAGFRVVGVRERVGRMQLGPMAGQWRDVVLVERRSRNVGV